eukprot:GHVR01082574.1.p1 GENE.GHVR01082574.1~~GHVR01082574.1.p1  ORF type:complete len:417 (+),score=79.55 GHVR01082574.1:28-1278(+)
MNMFGTLVVVVMMISGSLNTLTTKLQNDQCVENCDSSVSTELVYLNQPLYQSLIMFVGETFCLFFLFIYHVYYIIYSFFKNNKTNNNNNDNNNILHTTTGGGRELESVLVDQFQSIGSTESCKTTLKGKKLFLLALPALCDMSGTTLMMAAFVFVSASVYQLLRGGLVIFTGLMAVTFLDASLAVYKWVALGLVTLGVVIVGMSSINEPTTRGHVAVSSLYNYIGIFLMIFAQLFIAGQFVFEAKILSEYRVSPLRCVGFEGLFGLCFSLITMTSLHMVAYEYKGVDMFNMKEGFQQMFVRSNYLLFTSICLCVCIIGLNVSGLIVTKYFSCTSRSTFDTLRSICVWVTSVVLGWESFSLFEFCGFGVMVYGTFLFNGVVRPPAFLIYTPTQPAVVPTSEIYIEDAALVSSLAVKD